MVLLVDCSDSWYLGVGQFMSESRTPFNGACRLLDLASDPGRGGVGRHPGVHVVKSHQARGHGLSAESFSSRSPDRGPPPSASPTLIRARCV